MLKNLRKSDKAIKPNLKVENFRFYYFSFIAFKRFLPFFFSPFFFCFFFGGGVVDESFLYLLLALWRSCISYLRYFSFHSFDFSWNLISLINILSFKHLFLFFFLSQSLFTNLFFFLLYCHYSQIHLNVSIKLYHVYRIHLMINCK